MPTRPEQETEREQQQNHRLHGNQLTFTVEEKDLDSEVLLGRKKVADHEASSTLPARPSSSYVCSTVALCICMLTHSYLLISVFPYSGYMVVELIESANAENAGSFAGFLASSFMIGRATTSMAWGKAADTYGRTAVLCISLGLSCFFTVMFGLMPTFSLAIFARFCLGASNGIMGTIKTTVSDLTQGNENAETTMMSTVMGFWGWGFLLSPAISGALAEPIHQYPDMEWFQKGFVGHVLLKHPFLLPNLLGAMLCVVAAATVSLFVRETIPAERRRSVKWLIPDIFQWFRSCCRLSPTIRKTTRSQQYNNLPLLKAHDSNVFTPDDVEDDELVDDGEIIASVDKSPKLVPSSNPTIATLWARPETRSFLWLFWIYSFVGLTVDESFPLFCMSREAGFGLAENQIGKILSISGLLFATAQYSVQRTIYNRCGLYGSIRVGTVLSIPMVFLVPFSVLLNRGANEGEVRLLTFVFLSFIMALSRIFGLVFFSNISVATNHSVPAMERATMNGLSVLGGSVARAFGPIFAGFLVTFAVSLLGQAASILIYGSIGLLGCCTVALAFFILPKDEASKISCETEEVDTNKTGTAEMVELTKSQMA